MVKRQAVLFLMMTVGTEEKLEIIHFLHNELFRLYVQVLSDSYIPKDKVC